MTKEVLLHDVSTLGSLINVQVFKTSGTYTPTSGMSNCIIQAVGGGGAGGGAIVAALAITFGGGGGSGGFSQSYVSSATIGASQTVTIGSGGTGVSGAAGNHGSSTSVGSIVIANGGLGGSVISGSNAVGGAGGTVGTGNVSFSGGVGSNGFVIGTSGTSAISGSGGNSFFAGGGDQTVISFGASVNNAGNAGSANSGGGGSGGSQSTSTANAGGNGAAGIVIIYEFDSSNSVVLPTTTNHIATYSDTAGTLSEDPTTAITNGALSVGTTVTAGTGITATTGDITANTGNLWSLQGNVNAGSSGNSGALISWPTSGSNGVLALSATNAGGGRNTIISNGPMGQTTTYTIPDIGSGAGTFVVALSATIMKFVKSTSVSGGSASQTITDADCTSNSCVIGNWVTQTNAASVLTIVPSNGSFVVTSTADAGVGTFSYTISK